MSNLKIVEAQVDDGLDTHDVSSSTYKPDTEYPLAVLPPAIQAIIIAIHDLAQVAVEMAGQVSFSTISFAVQHITDVEVPRQGQKPLSSFFLTLAEASTGKTAAERFAMAAVNAYVDALEVAYEKQFHDYQIELKAYRQEIKNVERSMKDQHRDAIAEALKDVGSPPPQPLRPDMITRMATYKGLLDSLRDGQASAGLINDDSIGFIHGAANDPAMISLLTDIWSGTPYRRVTGRERLILKGRRLTAHLMVQPKHAADLLHGKFTADQGIIPRFNIAFAPLMEKTAPKGDRATHLKTVAAFNERIASLLQVPGAIQNRNEVKVETPMVMSQEAEEFFISFMDNMATAVRPGDDLSSIRTSAVRASENAARLAGVMTLFVHGPETTEIELPEMKAAVALMDYYMRQKLSLYDDVHVDPDIELAEKAWIWLSEKWDDPNISQRDLTNIGSPRAVRRADKAATVIGILERDGRLLRLLGKHPVRGIDRERVWKIVK